MWSASILWNCVHDNDFIRWGEPAWLTFSLKLDKSLLLTGRLGVKNESKVLAVFERKGSINAVGEGEKVLWIQSMLTISGFTFYFWKTTLSFTPCYPWHELCSYSVCLANGAMHGREDWLCLSSSSHLWMRIARPRLGQRKISERTLQSGTSLVWKLNAAEWISR